MVRLTEDVHVCLCILDKSMLSWMVLQFIAAKVKSDQNMILYNDHPSAMALNLIWTETWFTVGTYVCGIKKHISFEIQLLAVKAFLTKANSLEILHIWESKN